MPEDCLGQVEDEETKLKETNQCLSQTHSALSIPFVFCGIQIRCLHRRGDADVVREVAKIL